MPVMALGSLVPLGRRQRAPPSPAQELGVLLVQEALGPVPQTEPSDFWSSITYMAQRINM